MKFSIAAAIVACAASVAALPPASGDQFAGNGVGNKGNSNVKFPVRDDVTVQQASNKCGDQAQLSCCNEATFAGDSTFVADGLLAGALGNLVGAGSGAEGLGLFKGCSKLDVAAAIGVQDLVNQQCKQNIACCEDSGTSADGNVIGVALPCLALGSIL
ncbi:rodlet protein [Aspergillus granulosus]|uniref:Hydrophobin n=1 Tax=Aspergillus granulosus TaxID=176169 RepID=A0ABR4H2T7_9EURO